MFPLENPQSTKSQINLDNILEKDLQANGSKVNQGAHKEDLKTLYSLIFRIPATYAVRKIEEWTPKTLSTNSHPSSSETSIHHRWKLNKKCSDEKWNRNKSRLHRQFHESSFLYNIKHLESLNWVNEKRKTGNEINYLSSTI